MVERRSRVWRQSVHAGCGTAERVVMESPLADETFELLRLVVQVVHWAQGVNVGALTKVSVLVKGNSSKSHSPWKQEYNDLGKEGML